MSKRDTVLVIFAFVVYLIVSWFMINGAAANSKPSVVPCLLFKNGRFVKDKKEKCRQFDSKDQAKYNARLLKLKYYKKVLEPKHKKLVKDYRGLDRRWKITEGLAAQARSNLQQQVQNQKQNAAQWRKTAQELIKKKRPPKSWTEHPALWFGVGVVVAGAVVGITAYAVISAQPRLATATSP